MTESNRIQPDEKQIAVLIESNIDYEMREPLLPPSHATRILCEMIRHRPVRANLALNKLSAFVHDSKWPRRAKAQQMLAPMAQAAPELLTTIRQLNELGEIDSEGHVRKQALGTSALLSHLESQPPAISPCRPSPGETPHTAESPHTPRR